MPSNLKEAISIPLIKKACLDPEIFNHFRPSLTYLSKLIEKVVATRLFDQMTTNGLHECLQTSYKKYHSTETALTCIHGDILRAVDEKQCVILLLLDLSAAFDTIDHDMLLSRLWKYIGLCDTALNWFRSYLSQRQQSVLINGVKSKTVPLSCGVAQGSVLGPILLQFTSCLLVTSLENMVSNSTCMLMTVSCILHLACQQMRQYPACRWPLMIFVHGMQQIC